LYCIVCQCISCCTLVSCSILHDIKLQAWKGMGQESTARQLYSVASWACLTSCAETECEQMYCSFQNLRIISNHVNSLRPIIPISLPVLWANKIRQHFFSQIDSASRVSVWLIPGEMLWLCARSKRQVSGYLCHAIVTWVTHGLPMGYPWVTHINYVWCNVY
jgi:hypothetical protein